VSMNAGLTSPTRLPPYSVDVDCAVKDEFIECQDRIMEALHTSQ
jgi:hypothetical protein